MLAPVTGERPGRCSLKFRIPLGDCNIVPPASSAHEDLAGSPIFNGACQDLPERTGYSTSPERSREICVKADWYLVL